MPVPTGALQRQWVALLVVRLLSPRWYPLESEGRLWCYTLDAARKRSLQGPPGISRTWEKLTQGGGGGYKGTLAALLLNVHAWLNVPWRVAQQQQHRHRFGC